jgi:alanine-glyoxylate transaminase/serine-glyoxylate transaminase/serine-pyruvate transaminase
VLAITNGYFGDRLAQMCTRYGGEVTRCEADWGRACDPVAVRAALASSGAAVVTVVHAETSTGVLNPVRAIAAAAHQQDALLVVDAVTSLGGMPVSVTEMEIDALYSCSQKCLGAPPGLAPVMFMPRALERRVPCRSFYFDVGLLEDYWLRRKYHHTMSASLVYALREALVDVEEEGLVARWMRHQQNHAAFVAGAAELGLAPLAPEGERLWTLNAMRVPGGVDDAEVRKHLREKHNLEIGGGLGPLAGAIFRIGLMGAGSTPENVALRLAALDDALAAARPSAAR